jgi:hypothetical protein
VIAKAITEMMNDTPNSMPAATAVQNAAVVRSSFGESLHAASMAFMQADATAVATKAPRGKASTAETSAAAHSGSAERSASAATIQVLPVTIPQQPALPHLAGATYRMDNSEPKPAIETSDSETRNTEAQPDSFQSYESRGSMPASFSANPISIANWNDGAIRAAAPAVGSRSSVAGSTSQKPPQPASAAQAFVASVQSNASVPASVDQRPNQPVITGQSPVVATHSSQDVLAHVFQAAIQPIAVTSNPAPAVQSNPSSSTPALATSGQPVMSEQSSVIPAISEPATVVPAFQLPIGTAAPNSFPPPAFHSTAAVATTASQAPKEPVVPEANPVSAFRAGANIAAAVSQPQVPAAAANAVPASASHAEQNVNADATQPPPQNDAPQTNPDSTRDTKVSVAAPTVPVSALSATADFAISAAVKAPVNQTAASIPAIASVDQIQPRAEAPATSLPAPAQACNDSVTPNQLRALALSVSELIPQAQFAAPAVNNNAAINPSSNAVGKSDAKSDSQPDSVIKDSTASKQHTESAADQSAGKPATQESSTTNDQAHTAATTQDQNAASASPTLATHEVAAPNHDPAPAQAAPAQVTSVVAHGSSPVAKAPEQSAQVAVASPQQLPAINSARIIQSMGQTELRVGMRTTEFGNISISTSSTRDLISAQISVDHGELAKTIAAGLPEMQAKLGSNQGTDVRIEMNGTASGHGSGTSSNMASGSHEQSRGAKQQAGNSTSGNSGPGVTERQFASAAAVMAATEGRPGARLDITV